ncbi:hypothetical protein KUTeg_002324 [Tegillarca granosa]|uniref:Uncharacterized protein n=1 Tax=Tegillarca granosa TaxID=220873 RepID=A0ABQ9FU06_TEGGR|nr:hypothetical protein KUTeg_002324 [Tegillarca granosa]
MASTTKKLRKLDAICAKLKSVTNDEPTQTSTPEIESVTEKESENSDSATKHLTNGENDESFVSRRKKRKASTPRNIAQVREVLESFEDYDEKDELAEYKINNQNTTFPPEEDGDDESEHAQSPKNDLEKCNGIPNDVSASPVITNHNSINNISSIHSGNKKHSRKARKPQTVVGIPLDLSLSKTSIDSESVNDESFEENFCHQNEDSNGFSDTPEDLSIASENCKTGDSKSVSPADKNDSSEISISALKDYAENTMNELLQMYGFSGSEDSGVGQVSHKRLLQTVQSLSFKGDKSNLINSLIKNPAHLNGTVDLGLGLNTPLVSHLPSSVIKKSIYANFVSTANQPKPQISSDGLVC